MDEKEIENRAALIGRPFVNLLETAKITGISYPTIWRLAPEQKPEMFRMAGTDMMAIDDAVKWAKRYWREYSKSGRPQ